MYDVMDVLANGLSAARLKINVLSANIANADTTRTPEGGPYKRRDVVQMAVPSSSTFSSVLDKMSLYKPTIEAVIADETAPRKVYQPGHPDADKDGMVGYPNINVVSTMTDMMTASRLYQANVTALESARRLEQEALRIAQSY